MAEFRFSKLVKADLARTFDVFSDLRAVPQRIEGIKRLEVLTDGPMGVGTRFRETRMMFNREATEEMEVTDFQPGRSYTVCANSCGTAWTCTYRFQPESGGTRVDMEMICRPVTLFAKLMTPLSMLMSGPMKKMFEKDLDDLRRHLETNAN